MARVFLAILYDDAGEENSGKFSLVGNSDRFIAGALRYLFISPLPPAARVEVYT
jgi:hypothetical protein